MLGEWAGEEFPTGHPMDGALAAYGWRGKRFESEEDVHPLVFGTGARAYSVRPRWVAPGIPLLLRWPGLKKLVPLVRPLLPLLATTRSHARLRMVQCRGVLSATMVYDEAPIQDVFRRLEAHAVLGLMDMKGMAQPFFFVLRRARGPTMRE
jgi:hypothetical protein